jgi:hypothetical protein
MRDGFVLKSRSFKTEEPEDSVPRVLMVSAFALALGPVYFKFIFPDNFRIFIISVTGVCAAVSTAGSFFISFEGVLLVDGGGFSFVVVGEGISSTWAWENA